MTRTGTTALTLSEEIRQRFDEFSRSQKDVGQYIVDHLEEAAFHTRVRDAYLRIAGDERLLVALNFTGQQLRYPVRQGLDQARLELSTDPARAAASLLSEPTVPIAWAPIERMWPSTVSRRSSAIWRNRSTSSASHASRPGSVGVTT